MDLHTRTLRCLEWGRLKDFLADEALTSSGRSLCLEIEPAGQRLIIETLLQETSEALSMLQAQAAPTYEGLPEIAESLGRLKAGADLSGLELAQLRLVLTIARRCRGSLGLLNVEDFPSLSGLIPRLHTLPPLVKLIEQAVDDAGQMLDTASPLLNGLKKDVRRLDGRIKDELSKIIHSSTQSKALQEPIFTQRGGRYVLPVNASSRQVIPGIVHDSSASGLTVYVEPLAVVELANDVRVKETEVEREVARILSELSKQAAEHTADIETSFQTLVELDFVMARARLAAKYNGTRPQLSEDHKLELRSAHHPLLLLQDPAKAPQIVPNDIVLDKSQRTLVITGPNTGGKTVYLKTAGLMALMVQCGLLLPVAAGSTITIFKDVYADIGDDQSLAQSLSTFSSHMLNIVEIVRKADEDSLVLLDEIGAGTDPKEGAALARSLLEHLNDCGAYTIATTHYGELKILAYSQAGFLNASLEFDDVTLSPTYRLKLGIPGSSKATTIAARLGLPAKLVERTEELLKQGQEDVQKVIEELESRLKDVMQSEEEARLATASAREMESQARQKLDEVAAEREGQRRKFAEQMESEFKTVKETLREMIAELQKQPTSARALRAQKDMEVLRGELKWLQPARVSRPAVDLSVGQKVKVLSLNQIGTLEELPDNKQSGRNLPAVVRIGSLKVKAELQDLELVASAGSHKTGKHSAGSKKVNLQMGGRADEHAHGGSKQSYGGSRDQLSVFVRSTSNTLDLRGQRVDPALANLEKFLDAAAVSSISPLMIIHGHGTGAIKALVREYLAESSYPRSFRPGESYEGGDGVTIVNL